MEKNNNKPKLRFPGFTDPWEQRKVGEISDKVTEKNMGNFYDETLTNSAEFGIVTQRDFFDKDISNAKNLNGYYVVQNDDFVYNPRISNFAPVGPIKRNKLARTGVMSPLYYVFRTHDIDETYLEHYFDTTCWHSFMKLNGDSGARSDRFAIKDFVFIEMPIPFPNLEEQKKIGKFFDTITILITLHQRKLNHLQDKKKGLLQKMFPKSGQDFPELRYPEFTDPWKQCKFDEEVEFYSGLTYSPNDVNGNGTFVLRSSNVKNGEIVDADNVYVNSEVVNSSNVKEEDIIVVVRNGSRSLIGKHAQIKRKMDKTVIGAFMTGIRSNQSNFINALMDTQQFSGEIEKNLGATINQITNGMFREMRFMFPDVQEQNQIGNFFNNLDNLITLHQRKLNHLQEQKKSLLQQMFI